MNALDLFAGPGGWDYAAAGLGLDPLGIEHDDAACATRAAAGLRTVQADVSALDPDDFGPVDLLIASPPCQAWSMAGKRGGEADKGLVYELTDHIAQGREIVNPITGWEDERSKLVTEPLRWALALRPRYIALEQVPPVLDYWKHIAEILRGEGYSAWAGILEAERYGSIATCPLHDQRPAPSAERRFSLGELATADPAGTEWARWLYGAENVARQSAFAHDLASVAGVRIENDTDEILTVAASDAWSVASLARAAMDAADDATWRERVETLLWALPARLTPTGRAAGPWMNGATSGSGLTADIDVSTMLSPSDFWAELCAAARSFTTSTETSPTTPTTTSGCSPTTPPTRTTTTRASSRIGCSLCADHATPQTRERAILMASLDGPVHPPAPTHQRYVPKEPQWDAPQITLEGELLPWVSMAQALGWAEPVQTNNFTAKQRDLDGRRTKRGSVPYEREAEAPAPTIDTSAGGWKVGYHRTRGEGMEERHGERRTHPVDEPAPTLTEKARSDEWRPLKMRANAQTNACERDAGEPAPTITGGNDTGDRRWLRAGTNENDVSRPSDEPAPTIRYGERMNDVSWVSERPCTAVCADPRISPPGYRGRADDYDADGTYKGDRSMDNAVRVTEQEAAILQGFPPDYPWAGSRTKRFQQIGNAVPPPLAAAVLGELVGAELALREAA